MNQQVEKSGSLARLGMTEIYQAALMLPTRYDDLKTVARSILQLETRQPKAIHLGIRGRPTATFSAGTPRVRFRATDIDGNEFDATIFGQTSDTLERLEGLSSIVALATRSTYNGSNQATINEIVSEDWHGMIRPHYPSKRGSMSSEQVRTLIIAHLNSAIPLAAKHLEALCATSEPISAVLSRIGASNWTVEQVLWQVHVPSQIEYAQYSRDLLFRLGAYAAINQMTSSTRSAIATPLNIDSINTRISQLKVTPTADQLNAIEDIKHQLSQGKVVHHLVQGDVGTGKSLVIHVLCAAVADLQQGNVVVLAPNAIIAKQLMEGFNLAFPDIHAQLVTSESDSSPEAHRTTVFFGTTALLFRSIDPTNISLVVVDEQQRFSRAQRETLRGLSTHLVEFTATPIPRTQALLKLGHVTISELKESPVFKTFHTVLYEGENGRKELFDVLRPSLRSGDQVLFVYPKREPSENNGRIAKTQDQSPITPEDLHSVKLASERFEKMFPGKVAALTSETPDSEKQLILQAFVSKKIQLLICTTVIEVGLDLPNLMRIVIVCPERHGLVGLHQIRGRVARKGGDGHCDLYCPSAINDDQRRRLQFFCNTTDGFAVSEFDLNERGSGDLSHDSNTQSGADDAILFNTTIPMAVIEQVMAVHVSGQLIGA